MLFQISQSTTKKLACGGTEDVKMKHDSKILESILRKVLFLLIVFEIH